jgi:hypothetical protein
MIAAKDREAEVAAKKIKPWVFYRRDEKAFAAFKNLMRTEL